MSVCVINYRHESQPTQRLAQAARLRVWDHSMGSLQKKTLLCQVAYNRVVYQSTAEISNEVSHHEKHEFSSTIMN